MSYRIRNPARGCNHLSTDPCAHCEEVRLRMREAPVVAPRLFPSFSEDFKNEHAFHPWERVTPVSSREELRRQCAERGVESHYLRDSTVWRSGEKRWI